MDQDTRALFADPPETLFGSRPSGTRPDGQRSHIDLCSYGFGLVVIDKGRVSLCALDVPGFSHEYVLYAPTWCLGDTQPADGPFRPLGAGRSVLNLVGWDVSLDLDGSLELPTLRSGKLVDGVPEHPEQWSNWEIIELIPEVSEICAGASLAAQWSKRPALQSVFTFSAGEVSSIPAAFTLKETWNWIDPCGYAHVRAVTDILRYRSIQAVNPVLTATCRSTGKAYSYALQGNDQGTVPLLLKSDPAGHWYAEDPYWNDALDLAHIHATLLLCSFAGAVSCVMSPESKPIHVEKKPRGGRPSDSFGELATTAVPRPGDKLNCGKRIIRTL